MLYVVIGPPCAGKTTWVLERATPQDIVIDFDRLALALTGNGADQHNHAPALTHITMIARTAAIRTATRYAHQTNVYVIHSMPTSDVFARYCNSGASIVTIDPGREIVLDRCRQERPPQATEMALQWYSGRIAPSHARSN